MPMRQTWLVTVSCSLMLVGAVAAQTMDHRYFRGPTGPNCVASAALATDPTGAGRTALDDTITAPCPPPPNEAVREH